jgi:putative glutathione S-transferase
MGRLVDGEWLAKGPDPRKKTGKFLRADAKMRNWVTADGSSGFPAEAGRYHLYVSHACPWAHRTIIYRHLKGLDDAISHSYVEPLMLENGWQISDGEGPIEGARFMYHVYLAADSNYSGQCSVPVLWDKVQKTIVSNESSEIIRMLNSAFDGIASDAVDYYPEAHRDEIDAVNILTYDNINNGVYRSGFALTQEAYEEAVTQVFNALDEVEQRLSQHRYLVGNQITEADWRLFPTLVRFDAVYHGHFKCNIRRIADYPNVWNYLLDLFQQPGIADTVFIDKIKQHYYGSHETVNPTRIVPMGPEIDFWQTHNRDRFSS